MFTAAFVVASFAAAATAQIPGGLSTQCQGVLTSVATGPASQCLNVGGILPIVAASNTTSLVGPIDSWLGGLCGAPACDNSTVTSLATNVTTGCKTDIAKAGLSQSVLDALPGYVTQYYPVAREAVCLRDSTANNTLCVTSTLRTIESALNAPLTINNVISNVASLLGNSTLEKAVVCSPCAQGAYALIRSQLPSATATDTDSFFKSTCGDSFVSAGEPTNIIVATGALATPTPSKSGNAGFARAVLPTGAAMGGVALAALGGAAAFITML